MAGQDEAGQAVVSLHRKGNTGAAILRDAWGREEIETGVRAISFQYRESIAQVISRLSGSADEQEPGAQADPATAVIQGCVRRFWRGVETGYSHSPRLPPRLFSTLYRSRREALGSLRILGRVMTVFLAKLHI